MSLTTLSGDSTDAYNDVAHPERVMPETRKLTLEGGMLQVPPHSVSILRGEVQAQ